MRKIRAITVVLLLIAIFPVHSDFYKFLRIIVTLVAGITSYSSFKKNNIEWTIVFLFIALIWNPIIPIYLNKTGGQTKVSCATRIGFHIDEYFRQRTCY